MTILSPATRPPEGKSGRSGFGNPWRFSFDRMTGDLFIGDVDQDSREEINFLSATSAGGENYGWSRMEGSACFDRDTGLPLPPETPPEVCNDGSLVLPALEHFHEGRCGGSIIGGYVYRGAASPTLVGHYLYGDFCKGELRAAIPDGAGGWAIVAVRDTGFSITTFGEDEEGEIFVADLISGTVFLIRGTPPPPALSFIAPSSHVSGGGDFEIVAQGSFAPASVLQWNGEARPTYVFDTTKLRATISAADVAAPGGRGDQYLHAAARWRRVAAGRVPHSSLAGHLTKRLCRRRGPCGDLPSRAAPHRWFVDLSVRHGIERLRSSTREQLGRDRSWRGRADIRGAG